MMTHVTHSQRIHGLAIQEFHITLSTMILVCLTQSKLMNTGKFGEDKRYKKGKNYMTVQQVDGSEMTHTLLSIKYCER